MADYIHYDPDRTLYALTNDELEGIISRPQPLWKDTCLVSVSIGLPFLINAIAQTQNQLVFKLDIILFLNYLFGVLGILFGIVFGFAWRRSSQDTKKLIERIKSRPRMESDPSTTNIGALEEVKKEILDLKNKTSTWG